MKNKNLIHKLLKGEGLSKKEAEELAFTKKNEKHPFNYLFRDDQEIGRGGFGRVYPVMGFPNLVVKIPKDEESQKKILEGISIQEELYEQGYNIPKPVGVYNIYDLFLKEFVKGFIMQRIEGENEEKLDINRYKLRSKLNSTYNSEMRLNLTKKLNKIDKRISHMKKNQKQFVNKVKENYLVEDRHQKNLLFENTTQKTYFIDFDIWGRIER